MMLNVKKKSSSLSFKIQTQLPSLSFLSLLVRSLSIVYPIPPPLSLPSLPQLPPLPIFFLFLFSKIKFLFLFCFVFVFLFFFFFFFFFFLNTRVAAAVGLLLFSNSYPNFQLLPLASETQGGCFQWAFCLNSFCEFVWLFLKEQ